MLQATGAEHAEAERTRRARETAEKNSAPEVIWKTESRRVISKTMLSGLLMFMSSKRVPFACVRSRNSNITPKPWASILDTCAKSKYDRVRPLTKTARLCAESPFRRSRYLLAATEL